jgi:acetyl-CoA carboxylase biotin carboxyl carrier protein
MSENIASAKAEEKAENRGRKRRRSGLRKPNQISKASFNMAELRELAELFSEHGFTDFEFENENIRIRLSKMVAAPLVQSVPSVSLPATAPVSTTVSPPQAETAHEAEAVATSAEEDEDLYKITSPIVGTFYRAPAPDKEPYVKEGDRVNENTVVCIVEAMKLMNEIQAEVSGEVVKIYVENGQPVEFGQPLFGIRR